MDRDEVERVLERASGLATPGPGEPDNESFDEDAVVKAALEAGIPTHATKEALAIEKLGEPPAPKALDRLAGRRWVVIDRRLPIRADDCLEILDRWLVVGHHLRRQDGEPEAARWSRRRDPLTSLQLRARRISGDGGLGTAAEVEARVAEYEGKHGEPMTLVRVMIDRSGSRSTRLVSGGALVGGGATATALTATGVILVPSAAIAFGAATLGGLVVARTGRRNDRQLEIELRVLLDRIGRGDSPGSVTSGLVKGIANRRR